MAGSLLSVRDRRLRWGLPALLIAVVAFVLGIRVGTHGARQDRQAARSFTAAWARQDLNSMYGLLDAPSQTATSFRAFSAAYAAAARTATLDRIEPGKASKPKNGRVTVPMVVHTRVFGDVREPLVLPIEDGHVRWSKDLVFPGLRVGEALGRRTALPPRAALTFRDGRALARGPGRTSSAPEVAANIAGELGTPEADQRRRLALQGYPPNALVGTSGLERVFERDLAGTPGGVLRAGTRVLASSKPKRGRSVRTSIDVEIERTAIAALAGRLGGAAAIDPRTGEILALAGIAFSGLQPPGSTFKVITAAAALKKGISPARRFPVQTAATLEGRRLENANGESCGGTFLDSFAHSCNSVFAPVGVEVGAKELVAAAEAFGFNHSPGIPGAETSTIPKAGEIGDNLAVGSSAIGQGKVQATALEMGLVASTVAAGGRRPKLTLRARPARPVFVRAISPKVARTLRRFMQAVVAYGTGTPAKISGVVVAGKTGTAELQDTSQPTDPNNPAQPAPVETDAWFVAFAPAARPRIATGVLLVQAGAGGAVAAPAARQILQAGLRRK